MKLKKTKSLISKVILGATFIIALFISQTINASCYVCLNNGQCGELLKSCGDYRMFSCISSCEDCTINTYNPQTDYIVIERNGGASIIVKNQGKILIFGDRFESFLTELVKKYANAKRDDEEVQKRIIDELEAFRKTDDHKVSRELLAHISKDTGLKIRESVKNRK